MDENDQQEPGVKLDSGKLRAGLVLGEFKHALIGVCEVGTFGANKYTPKGWLKVENGIERYTDAFWRHLLALEEFDLESGLLHLKHRCWNDLAILELVERERFAGS